ENININEDTFSIEIVDKRKQLSRTLPKNVYDATTYPNIKDTNVGEPIPLGYGTILNAPAVCLNEKEATATFTFKLVDVADHVYGINSIDTVYVENDPDILTVVTPSSTDLLNGEFVLTAGVYSTSTTVTADFKGFDIIANYDWIDRGNCESTTSPMISGETVPVFVDALWVRDDTEADEDTYSYKFTKDVAAGSYGIVYLVDNADTTDMHGLIASHEYTLTMRILIPSGGILGSEVLLQLLDYDGGFVATEQVAANTYDEWQTVTVARTLRAAATGFITRIAAHSDAEDQEFFYVDNIRLSSSTVPRIGQNGVQIIQDLMTTYFPISFDSNFFNTTAWDSAVVA
ncbi:hypothetical protein LCGC14_3107030, partial [marine sediment metagenome]